MTHEQLKILRLEREQVNLVGTIQALLESIEVLVKYSDFDAMRYNEVYRAIESQKTSINALSNLMEGE